MQQPADAPASGLAAVWEDGEDVDILYVYSDVDIASGPAFESLLAWSFGRDRKTLIDLTECPYLDSTGLRLLLRAQKTLEPLLEVLVAPNSIVARALSVSGLDAIIPVSLRTPNSVARILPSPAEQRARGNSSRRRVP